MATTAEKTAERIQQSVPTTTDPTMAGGNATDAVPVAGTETAEAPAEAAPSTPSAKDNFRNRFSQKYSDVNMDDEEAYYGKANQMMDEYDDQQTKLDNVRNAVGSSEDFQDLLAELAEWNTEHPDQPYSIMHYLAKKVQQGELDLDELSNNPDYADKIAEAQAKKTKDADEQKALEEEGSKNFEESIAMMQRVRDERGLTDEQVNSAMEKVYAIYDDLSKNLITEENFCAILDAQNYDTAVADARDEGKAEGLNTKVTDKLRKMPKTSERAGGSQSPMAEQKPEAGSGANMFGL